MPPSIPEKLAAELRSDVNKAVWLLRLLKSTPKNDGAYKSFLRRFREIVLETSHKMYAIRYFVPDDDYARILSDLDCVWDDKSRRLHLPNIDD